MYSSPPDSSPDSTSASVEVISCHASVNQMLEMSEDYEKKNTDVQANFLVGEHSLLLIVALVETYGRPSKKEGGSSFAHTENIDDAAIFYQNSYPASETLIEERDP